MGNNTSVHVYFTCRCMNYFCVLLLLPAHRALWPSGQEERIKIWTWVAAGRGTWGAGNLMRSLTKPLLPLYVYLRKRNTSLWQTCLILHRFPTMSRTRNAPLRPSSSSSRRRPRQQPQQRRPPRDFSSSRRKRRRRKRRRRKRRRCFCSRSRLRLRSPPLRSRQRRRLGHRGRIG